jgi:hypothetical protein
MKTTLRARCSICCLETDFEPSDVLLVVEEHGGHYAGTYRWFCAECEQLSEKQADGFVVAMLLGAGVPCASDLA